MIGTRYDTAARLHVLVKCLGMPSHETTWMLIANFISQFPSYALEGKLNDGGGGVLISLIVVR